MALSDLESTVTEVAHWKTNVKAVATFYRGSALQYEELTKICNQEKRPVYRFPAYFEVRFVEHLVNLSKAVWKNLPCLEKHWKWITESNESTKVEKATARGFLRLWKDGGEQQHLTCLMMDVLRHFEKLQKDCQKSMITLSDMELSKKIVADALTLMESGPYPGGLQEDFVNEHTGEERTDTGPEIPRIRNSFVSTKRCWSAVRREVVLSCKKFLSQRLDQDQENILNRMNKFIDVRKPTELIQAVRTDVENLFGKNAVSSFSDDVVSLVLRNSHLP